MKEPRQQALAFPEPRPAGRFLLNLLRSDAEALARRDRKYRIGEPLAAGGKTRKELTGLGVVGLYTLNPAPAGC